MVIQVTHTKRKERFSAGVSIAGIAPMEHCVTLNINVTVAIALIMVLLTVRARKIRTRQYLIKEK